MSQTFQRVEFNTYDGVTLRGNYYKVPQQNAPVVILAAGLSFLKEHFIDAFAERFQSVGIAALAYDHRNWGSSDGLPRHETDFFQQANDYSDAVTFVLSLAPEIDPKRIAIWGAGHAGGVVMPSGAIDSRVKAVVTMVPFISGEVDASFFPGGYLKAALEERQERVLAASKAKPPKYVPTFTLPAGTQDDSITSADQTPSYSHSIIPAPEATSFHDACKARSDAAGTPWPNIITLQTLWNISKFEPQTWIHAISPKPLLYIVGERDKFITVDRQKKAFEKAGEPKQWVSVDSEHLDTYMGDVFEENVKEQVQWLKQWL